MTQLRQNRHTLQRDTETKNCPKNSSVDSSGWDRTRDLALRFFRQRRFWLTFLRLVNALVKQLHGRRQSSMVRTQFFSWPELIPATSSSFHPYNTAPRLGLQLVASEPGEIGFCYKINIVSPLLQNVCQYWYPKTAARKNVTNYIPNNIGNSNLTC